MSRTAVLASAIVVLVELSSMRAYARPSSGTRCPTAKSVLAGQGVAGLTDCDGKAVAHGIAVSSVCSSRALGKFARGWARAEARGTCTTTGDEMAIEGKVKALDAELGDRLQVSGLGSRCTAGK